MKTNALPAVIMLTAGLIDCICSILCHMPTDRFIRQLLLVLIIFYVIGCVVKIILDSNFKDMETEEAEKQETKENETQEEQTEESAETESAENEDSENTDSE